MPHAWRTKFDLDGYVPADHSKTRLIEACEAIERNELLLDKTKSKEDTSHSKKRRNIMLDPALSLVKSKSRVVLLSTFVLSMGTIQLIAQQTAGL